VNYSGIGRCRGRKGWYPQSRCALGDTGAGRVGILRVIVHWEWLGQTSGVGSSIVQEEVVCVTDELLAFGNDWAGLSGSAEGKGAGALGVVVMYQELRRTGGVG